MSLCYRNILHKYPDRLSKGELWTGHCGSSGSKCAAGCGHARNCPATCAKKRQGEKLSMRTLLILLIAAVTSRTVLAATLRVPQDHMTIQAAIDASHPGDTVLVAAGEYRERVRLRPGVVLRSEGEDAQDADGRERAKRTVLDGGGNAGDRPGVVMAEGSTLDGFTITHVGVYDDELWKKHFDSQGEELGDDEGAVQAEGTIPAVWIHGTTCVVTRCIVHHNGDVGIGILGREGTNTAPLVAGNCVYRNMGGGIGVAEGAEPIVRENLCHENLRAGIGCRAANPLLIENICSGNVRAGIGCREAAKPILRGNRCFGNRRAGIGIRMEGTAPVVEANECYENEMAGIGCQDGATPLVVGNICRENDLAGIGVEQHATAILEGNTCLNNRLVAIGVREGATAIITNNDLSRATGGPAPIIAVREGSSATILDNRITGGGVAAVLVQGKATVRGNTFIGTGEKQGNAVWVWEDSTATISGNSFHGYRAAVSAKKASVVVTGNTIRQFQKAAIVLKESKGPVHIVGNTAFSQDAAALVVEGEGPSGVVEGNVVKKE